MAPSLNCFADKSATPETKPNSSINNLSLGIDSNDLVLRKNRTHSDVETARENVFNYEGLKPDQQTNIKYHEFVDREPPTPVLIINPFTK